MSLPARAPQPVTPTQIRAFAQVEIEAGGRQALAEALAVASVSDKHDYVAGLIADPEHDRLSLAEVCALGKVKLPALLKAFEESLLVVARMKAAKKIAASLPTVAGDVMERAVAHTQVCWLCHGYRWLTPELPEGYELQDGEKAPQPTICPECNGIGQLRHVPSDKGQELALKLGGLIIDKPQIQITNNQQNLNMGGADPGALDRLIQMTDQTLYRGAREAAGREQTEFDSTAGGTVVEAETLPVEPEVQE